MKHSVWPFPSRAHRAPACVPATVTSGPRGSMGEEVLKCPASPAGLPCARACSSDCAEVAEGCDPYPPGDGS